MGQIANQALVELCCRIRQRMKEKRREKNGRKKEKKKN